MIGEGVAGSPGRTSGGPEPRVPALDLLRGVAVLGILLINIPVFGMPPVAITVPGDPAAAQVADFAVWTFSEVFVEGTMRALFSMLFGASMLLMTGAVSGRAGAGAAPVHAIDLYARRSLWLVAFGLVHAYLLLWPYDILYAYGLLGLLLLPLRVLSVRALLLAGLAMLAATAAISGLEEPPPESPFLAGGMKETQAGSAIRFASLPEGLMDVTPPDEEIRLSAVQAQAQDAIDIRRAGYWDNFLDMAGITARLQSDGFYRTNVFDIGGMMLIGMALLKAGVLTGRRRRRFYWLMLATGYGAGLAVNGVETWASVNSPEDSAKFIYWTGVTYDLGRLPTALGHVAALMLLMNAPLFEGAARLICAAGRLALTNYVMQTVICNTIFLGAGFGLFGMLRLHQLMIAALLIGAGQIVFSVLWLRFYRMGPLEWVLRSLVRWSPQPLRRRAGHPAQAAPAAAGR